MTARTRSSHRLMAAAPSAALVAAACTAVLGPEVESMTAAWLRLSTETVAGVSVALHVADTIVAAGDSVLFIATATNTTGRRVQIGTACGPSFDVQVTEPDGDTRSVLRDLVSGDAAFVCVLLAEHFVPAKATRALPLRWPAPARAGTYSARAGLRRDDGLANLSAPVTFRVR